jgi:hypothetical protein
MRSDLHQTYAPIMHFARGERFYPMSADRFLSYAALYRKDETRPILDRGQLTSSDLTEPGLDDSFLRSVDQGPLQGIEVAGQWGKDTLSMLYQFGQRPIYTWSEELARGLYGWFSEKTRAATQHFWWNELLLRQDRIARPGGARAELPRFVLPQSVRDAAAERYTDSQQGQRDYAYYYRTFRQGRYLTLQYWFFYAYNDWVTSFGGFNDHEGDWEGIQLFFELDGERIAEPPAYVCYLGHHSRITKPWDHPDIQRTGTHPHVYVAAGSHASYPERKRYTIMSLYDLIDHATGDALILDHDEWRSRMSLDEAPWVHAYRGSWGTRYWLRLSWIQRALGLVAPGSASELTLPGVSAPRGARYGDDGEERATWSDSASFAGIL